MTIKSKFRLPWIAVAAIVLAIAGAAIVVPVYYVRRWNPPPNVLPAGTLPFDPRPVFAKIDGSGDKSFRFAFLSDGHNSAGFEQLAKYLDEAVKPDFVINGGDSVSYGFGRTGPYFWQRLANEEGPYMRLRPWWPVMGNHEAYEERSSRQEMESNRTTNWKKFYGMECDYYSFVFHGVRFITLPFLETPGLEEWLENELKSAEKQQQRVFAFRHVPFYTVGIKPKSEVPNQPTPLTRLFTKYHVAAVISGHDHGYYRTLRDGVYYVVAGGGGGTIYAANRRDEGLPTDVWYKAEPSESDSKKGSTRILKYDGPAGGKITPLEKLVPFAVKIDVSPNSMRAACISIDGTILDEFDIAENRK